MFNAVQKGFVWVMHIMQLTKQSGSEHDYTRYAHTKPDDYMYLDRKNGKTKWKKMTKNMP